MADHDASAATLRRIRHRGWHPDHGADRTSHWRLARHASVATTTEEPS
jgi:hypothetical protein